MRRAASLPLGVSQAFVLAVTMTLGHTTAQQPSATEAEPEESRISGIVVSATTRDPLRGAVVWARRVSRGRGPGPRTASLANASGAFLLEGLPAGEYALFAAKTGYERRRSSTELAKVRVSGRDEQGDVVLRLRPAVAIEGRVVNDEGDPLTAQVIAYRRSFQSGAPPLAAVGQASSNDLGEYRIFGLPAGRYIVGAWPSSDWGAARVSFRHRASFFPSAETGQEAVELALDWGAERAAVDFRLGPAPRTELIVSLADSTGDGACDSCSFEVISLESGQNAGTDTNKEGLGSIAGLPPGPYLVNSYKHASAPRSAREKVELVEGRTERLALSLAPGVLVSGRVVFEDPPEELNEARARRPMTVRLDQAIRSEPQPRPAVVAADGAFEAKDVPSGVHRIRLDWIPEGGYLKALQIDRRELTEPAIAVSPGVPINDVVLRVAFDGASVTGIVRSSDSKRPPQGVVRLYPEGGTSGFARFRGTRILEDGSFSITSVVPGAYRAYALANTEMFDLGNPAVQRTLESKSERVRAEAEEGVQIELDLISE